MRRIIPAIQLVPLVDLILNLLIGHHGWPESLLPSRAMHAPGSGVRSPRLLWQPSRPCCGRLTTPALAPRAVLHPDLHQAAGKASRLRGAEHRTVSFPLMQWIMADVHLRHSPHVAIRCFQNHIRPAINCDRCLQSEGDVIRPAVGEDGVAWIELNGSSHRVVLRLDLRRSFSGRL